MLNDCEQSEKEHKMKMIIDENIKNNERIKNAQR